MPKRPTVWIHRTRRFWIGIVLLVLLAGTTFLCSGHRTEYYRQSAQPVGTTDEGWPLEEMNSWTLVIGMGGISIEHSRELQLCYFRSAPSVSWGKDSHPDVQFRSLPTVSYERETLGPGASFTDFAVFIPILLLIVLTCLLWLWWMYCAERKEQKLYESAHR